MAQSSPRHTRRRQIAPHPLAAVAAAAALVAAGLTTSAGAHAAPAPTTQLLTDSKPAPDAPKDAEAAAAELRNLEAQDARNRQARDLTREIMSADRNLRRAVAGAGALDGGGVPDADALRAKRAQAEAELTRLRLAAAAQQQILQPMRWRGGFRGMNGALTDEALNAIYVPDSSKALEQLRLAQRLETQDEWAKAAEIYQEIADTLGDRVVSVSGDNEPRRYVAVGREIEARLAKWPPAGLAAYTSRFEAAARDALTAAEAADSPAAYARVVDRYFFTESALRAGLHLIDLSIEDADFPAALDLTQRFLAMHPLARADASGADTLQGRAGLLFRGAVSAGWAGDTQAAKQCTDELSSAYAAAKATVGGHEVTLATEAARVQPKSAARSEVALAGWPMPGGTPARSAVSDATGRASALVGKILLPGHPKPTAAGDPPVVTQRRLRGIPRELDGNRREADEIARREGRDNVVLPVADRGQLFFQDGVRIWGVSLQTGKPLDGWAATYPTSAPQAGIYTTPRGLGSARDYQYSLTLTDDAVLGVLGYTDAATLSNAGIENTRPPTRLVKLDRATGKSLWEQSAIIETNTQNANGNSPANAPANAPANPVPATPAPASALLELSGSPLVLGDSVYVAARGSKGNGFDDAYVVCFDYATGNVRWTTYVASAATAATPFGGMDQVGASPTVIHLAAAAGRIYIQTNLGAVAAISAATGHPQWISLYTRDMSGDREVLSGRAREYTTAGIIRPWQFNAPILTGDSLVSLPTDGRDLLVLSTADGSITNRIPRSGFDNAATLVHADPKSMILASNRKIFAFDWTPGQNEATPTWRSDIGSSELRGRPFLTGSALLVPTVAKLFGIKPSGGLVAFTTPASPKTWENLEGQGNVIAVGDQVVIATAERVEIYTDFDKAQARYADAARQHPQDVETRLTWAEILFNSGRLDEATATLDESAALAKTSDTREKVFATAAWMSKSLAASANANAGKTQTDLRERSLSVLDRAARAAETPAQQVAYRDDRARMLTEMGDLPGAVAVWQEILAEPSWRSLRVKDAENTSTDTVPSGEIARREVQEIITRSPRVYEKFEKEAADLLAAATDAAALREVADRYPNSEAAAGALASAAQKLETAGDPATAARLLESLYLQYPSAGRRGATLESLTRIALASQKDPARAAAFAASGARLYPQYPLASPILGATSFAGVSAALRDQLKPQLPKLGLPGIADTAAYRKQGKGPIPSVTDDPGDQLPGVRLIIPPSTQTPPSDPALTVVMLSTGDLACLRDGAKIVWKQSFADTAGRGFLAGAFLGAGDASHWVGYSTAALVGATSADKSKPAWTLKLADLPAIPAPQAGAEAAAPFGPNIVNIAVQPPGLQPGMMPPGLPMPIPGGAQFFHIIAGPNGRTPARPVEEITSGKILADRIIAATTFGRILCVSTTDGKLLWQSRVTDGTLRPLLVNETFAVALSTTANGVNTRAQIFSVTDGVQWDNLILSDSDLVQNATLSPDGLLIYTLQNQLCARDLYRPGDPKPAFQVQVPTPGFQRLTSPGHLLTWDGLVLAMTDGGFLVRAFVTADGGAPLKLPAGSAAGSAADTVAGAISAIGGRTTDDPQTLSETVVDDRLYVRGPRSLVSYDLRHLSEDWRLTPETFGPSRNLPTFESAGDLTVASDFVLFPAPPVQSKDKWSLRLYALSREPDETGKESGIRLHELLLPNIDPTNLTTQTITGGLYYVDRNNTLHFLRATAASAAPSAK